MVSAACSSTRTRDWQMAHGIPAACTSTSAGDDTTMGREGLPPGEAAASFERSRASFSCVRSAARRAARLRWLIRLFYPLLVRGGRAAPGCGQELPGAAWPIILGYGLSAIGVDRKASCHRVRRRGRSWRSLHASSAFSFTSSRTRRMANLVNGAVKRSRANSLRLVWVSVALIRAS